jgi:hypothetical protein
MARKGFKIPGVSFSWKRASGLTSLRQKVARATGIPTTAAGRRRKFGLVGLVSLLTRGGRPTRTEETPAATRSQGSAWAGCVSALLALVALAVASMFCCGFAGVGGLYLASLAPPAESPSTKTNDPPKVNVPVEQAEIPDLKPEPVKLTEPAVAIAPTPVPAAPAVPTIRHNHDLRTWSSGTFHVEASFVSAGAGKVKLQKTDGRVISVDLEKLSEADRAYVHTLR